jgi:arginase
VENLGWKVAHDEDVVVATRTPTNINKLKDPHWVGAVCKEVHDRVYERAKRGDLLLTLGGDHSIATGSISAILRAHPETYVIWVDAHADINTPETTGSGNLHGMPVAFLAKLAGDVEGFEWLREIPALRLDRIFYVGLRDVDEGEKELLKKHGIKHFWSREVSDKGIAAVTTEVLEAVKGLPIHISFDIDALDPVHAPATGTPVHDGITLDDGIYLCQKLADTGRVVSMDLVEVNPLLSDAAGADITHKSGLELVNNALRRKA